MALTAQMQAALARSHIHPVTFVEVDWPVRGMTYWHSGVGPLDWGGHTWLGIGQFGSVSFPQASASVIQQRATIQVVLSDDEGLEELEQPVRNRHCRMHWGLLDIDTLDLVPTPVTRLIGRLDAARFTLSGSGIEGVQTVFQLEVTSGVPARRVGLIEHSHEDQSELYPGDTAGKHLWNIAVDKLTWG